MVLWSHTTQSMNAQEFKEWLKEVDIDKDGRISRKELRAAIKALGQRFAWLKAWRALAHADLNRNKHIDGEKEIDALIEYAKKSWGIIVTN